MMAWYFWVAACMAVVTFAMAVTAVRKLNEDWGKHLAEQRYVAVRRQAELRRIELLKREQAKRQQQQLARRQQYEKISRSLHAYLDKRVSAEQQPHLLVAGASELSAVFASLTSAGVAILSRIMEREATLEAGAVEGARARIARSAPKYRVVKTAAGWQVVAKNPNTRAILLGEVYGRRDEAQAAAQEMRAPFVELGEELQPRATGAPET